MNIKVDYLDHQIVIDKEHINIIEVSNKDIFIRLINDFKTLNSLGIKENMYIYNDKGLELNLSNKISIIIDYFNLNFNDKKYITKINKIVEKSVSDEECLKLSNLYKKMCKCFNRAFNEIDIELNINNDYQLEDIIKMFEIQIKEKETFLDKLFLLIDINGFLKVNSLLLFVNIKDYLSDNELIELHKYIMYKKETVLFIENKLSHNMIKYEKKLIIDEDLVEYVV